MSHTRVDFRTKWMAAITSLGVGLAMLVGKWAAYMLTGSNAILSDALESVVHVAATGFAFLSILLTARPPDPKYPYGYGKISYFSAGFEGGMIALASVAILFQSYKGLFYPQPLDHLGIGLVLIFMASAVNLILGLWLIGKGKKTDSLILTADGQHVLTDAYTSFGVVAGVALVKMTGLQWLDPVVASIVGLNILKTGYQLVKEAVLGLMDRADPELLARIVKALQEDRCEGWIDVHQLRAWKAGDRAFVDFHMVIPHDWTAVQLHEAHDRVRETLTNALGDATEVIIHFDPDTSPEFPEANGLPWSLEEAVRDPGDERDVSSAFKESAIPPQA